MNIEGIGVDIVEVARFRTVLRNKKTHFIDHTFTAREQTYCFAYKDPAPHFAGTFAAKEAVRKATGDISSALLSTEVRHHKTGKPEIWIKDKKKASLFVSITHSKSSACAIVISQLS